MWYVVRRKCSIRIQKEHSNTNIREIAQKNRISNIEFESNTITIWYKVPGTRYQETGQKFTVEDKFHTKKGT
jgi:hypothetical protein